MLRCSRYTLGYQRGDQSKPGEVIFRQALSVRSRLIAEIPQPLLRGISVMVQTFDNLVAAFHFHMYQLAILANSGELGEETVQVPPPKHYRLSAHPWEPPGGSHCLQGRPIAVQVDRHIEGCLG
jgi:hypothetical protein